MTPSSESCGGGGGGGGGGGDAPVAPRPSCGSEPPASACAAAGVSRLRAVLAVFLAVLGGTLLVTQNGINTNLRLHAVQSPFPAALVSFSVGLVAVSSISMFFRKGYRGGSLRHAPWYAYTGGILGPVYVVSAILVSSRLGFAAFQLCAISGMLMSGLLCDGVGFLLLPKRKPTVWRAIAILCTVLGAGLTSTDLELKEDAWTAALFCSAAFAGGAIFPVQAAVNAVMQKHVLSPFRAVMVSFTGGVIVLTVISAVAVSVADEPLKVGFGEPWMWLGGCCGAALVTCNVVGLPILGATAFTAIFLAAQLSVAAMYDMVGAFGFQPVPWSPRRICGILVSIGAAVAVNVRPQLPCCSGATAASAPGATGPGGELAAKCEEVEAGGEGCSGSAPLSEKVVSTAPMSPHPLVSPPCFEQRTLQEVAL